MNPDAIFYGGGDAQSSPMIRKMRQLGMKSAFVTGEMSRSPTFLKVGGDAAEGAIVYMGGLPKEKMPGFAGYAARYKARFNEDVITYSPYSYDGTIALLTAMKDANSTDPKVYTPYLGKVSVRACRPQHRVRHEGRPEGCAGDDLQGRARRVQAGRYDRRQLIRKTLPARRVSGSPAAPRASASASASRSEPFLGAHPRACISRSCRIPTRFDASSPPRPIPVRRRVFRASPGTRHASTTQAAPCQSMPKAGPGDAAPTTLFENQSS